MKQFTTTVSLHTDHRSKKSGVRITIPYQMAEMFRLEKDDIVILEPDMALGFIRLIPAKVVPRNGLAKLEPIKA